MPGCAAVPDLGQSEEEQANGEEEGVAVGVDGEEAGEVEVTVEVGRELEGLRGAAVVRDVEVFGEVRKSDWEDYCAEVVKGSGYMLERDRAMKL